MDETLNQNVEQQEETLTNIERVNIDGVMKQSFLDYGMSVIVARALPDVRDGLKPVQRRVLYGMERLGVNFGSQTKKCARIVGDVMGKFHPHGDSSVYLTLVHMAQEWSLRYPLIFGQGNFGSMDGDSPAAYRYTEAKLAKITAEVLADLDKNTVDFRPNFDETETEPTVLPTKLPLALLNGSTGIAVGMATNMAPHNLSEVCDGICAYIDNPEITIDELMQYIQAPDFPTGGVILGLSGVRDAFNNGRGRIVIRSKCEIETLHDGKEQIVATEIPYMVNKREMIQKIAELAESKKVEGIDDVNDESDKDGIRVVIKLKKGANSSVVLNTLYKLTPLQSSFSVNNVVLVNGRPKLLNLKDLLRNFVEHRHEVVVRRTKFELDKALERIHIVEGLLKALDLIDEVIATIRASRTVDSSKQALIDKFGFTEKQAAAIVAMRLGQLAGMEREKLQKEYDDLSAFIAHCNEILGSVELQMGIIKDETREIQAKYGDERRSRIELSAGEDFNPEDFYPNEDVMVTISHLGYIKRTSLAEYKTQSRGGVGAKASGTKDQDFIESVFVANMHATIIFFTENCRCYWKKVYELPEGNKASKGRSLANVLPLGEDKIKAFIKVTGSLKDQDYINSNYVVLVSKQGIVKKSLLENYSRPKVNGIIAHSLREGDSLLEAALTRGEDQILIASREGQLVRFEESKVRPMGRQATGVKGMELEEGGELVGVIAHDPQGENAAAETVLVVSENGFGKRTDFDEYRITNRGGKGVKTINITEKTGTLVAIKTVTDENDLMIITKKGIAIRMSVKDIRVAGRNTQGVKLINLRGDDQIASVSVVNAYEEEEQAPQDGAQTETINEQ